MKWCTTLFLQCVNIAYMQMFCMHGIPGWTAILYPTMQCLPIDFLFLLFFLLQLCFVSHITSAVRLQTLYKSVYECNALWFRSSEQLEFSNSEWFKQFTATLWGLRFRSVEFLPCKLDFMMIKTVIVLTHWPLAGWLTN